MMVRVRAADPEEEPAPLQLLRVLVGFSMPAEIPEVTFEAPDYGQLNCARLRTLLKDAYGDPARRVLKAELVRRCAAGLVGVRVKGEW